MTLVDSAAGITATFMAAMARVPGARHLPVGRDEIWPYIGLPLEDTARALAPDVDEDLVVAAYRELYPRLGVPATTLLPGALHALAAVRAAGGRILVVSAKREAAVHAVLEVVGLARGELAPDVVVGGLFAGAKGVRLKAEGADIYVGDHSGDVLAAQVAGAFSVAVTTGPQSEQTLVEAGADLVLPGLAAFADWLPTVAGD